MTPRAVLDASAAIHLVLNGESSEALEDRLTAASTYRHSVYDMMYAVLARRQGAVVITLDAKFAKALQGMRVEVYCPGDNDQGV